jgi:hypothetical protein
MNNKTKLAILYGKGLANKAYDLSFNFDKYQTTNVSE